MIVFLIILLVSFLFILIFGCYLSAPRYVGPVSDHFDGRKFLNPGNARAKGASAVLRWIITRKRGQWPDEKFDYGERPVAMNDTGVRVTFVNHSTFLIQFDGLNVLTDPVWSERTSPFEWAGPKRKRPPGIKFEDLPAIDIVLLTHNHWDHLDIRTIKKLEELYRPKFITPLGVDVFLKKHGIACFGILDWWNQVEISSTLAMQGVPAQHFSGRGMFDRDATLWLGYVIKRPQGNIYFAGDTGYNPTTFKEIGTRCCPIKIAFIPIGAYKPEWFMQPIHCSPHDAVSIHRDTGSPLSIAMHFGTFQLADDGKFEPVSDLTESLEKQKLDLRCFIVLKEGVPLDLAS